MRKFIWAFIFISLIIPENGFGQDAKKERRISISIGASSPQFKKIRKVSSSLNATYAESYGDDFPNLNVSFEVKDPEIFWGYGGILAFDNNYWSTSYYDVNFDYENESYTSYRLTQDYNHILLGGSFFLYPDQWIPLNKLGIYARSTAGLEVLAVHNWIEYGMDSKSINRTEIIPFISLYAGIRYSLFKHLELQAEFGYRELAIMKFGFNIKY